MVANVASVRTTVDAITKIELALSGALYELSFSAEYGHGVTGRAIEALEDARAHANRAVVAAALGNVIMATKHEVQSAAADADAVGMLGRARSYADELRNGLNAAAEETDSALGLARSLVGLDDSSPAAQIHAKIAAQPEAVRSMLERVEEIDRVVPGSRDPGELQVAAEHFIALRHELEENAGRAQEIASDLSGYDSTL